MTSPATVAALRGLILALLMGAVELALSEGDLSWRTVVLAVVPFVIRWLGEGVLLDRNDGPQPGPLGVNR